MGMSDFYDPEMQDEEESLRVFEKCIERGVNLLDTGDFYGAGRNEKLIGNSEIISVKSTDQYNRKSNSKIWS